MNTLSSLLTRRNIEIIKLIAEQDLSLRSIAVKLKCSPGKVHQAIKIFKKNGLVETEKNKNRLLIKPRRKNPIYKKIKALININEILNSRGYQEIKRCGIVGIYGSYAEGTDNADSDVDILILTNKKELELRSNIRSWEAEIGKKINPLIITKQKLIALERDKEFYIRLKLTVIELNGDIFD